PDDILRWKISASSTAGVWMLLRSLLATRCRGWADFDQRHKPKAPALDERTLARVRSGHRANKGSECDGVTNLVRGKDGEKLIDRRQPERSVVQHFGGPRELAVED